jgi:hypothetical protein
LSDAGLETLLLESRKTLKNRFALQPLEPRKTLNNRFALQRAHPTTHVRLNSLKRSDEQDRFTITGSNETATFKETWEPERTSSV